VVVFTSGSAGAGSPVNSASQSDDDTTQSETVIGWADVQDILHDFIVPNAPRLAKLTQWDAEMEQVATEFCSRRLLVLSGGEDGGLLPQVSSDMSLLEAVSSGFLSLGGAGAAAEHLLTPRSRGLEEGREGEPGPDAMPGRAVHRLALFAGGRIRALVSQSDCMRFLYHNSERMGPLARESVEALGFVAASKKVLCVGPQTPAFVAFTTMYAAALSAVGIVDPGTEALVGTLSASDVRRLQAHTFSTLMLPVTEFLSAQAPAAQRGPRTPLSVTPNAPFLRVLELLGGSPRIHRVYVCDADGRPVGVVRLRLAASCALACHRRRLGARPP